ncbi:multidrug efflux system protein [Gammaproteobacteria bacterium]|nr:multidrug efflux system protein [Gammaproteobacteria bacterium]
MAWIYLIFAGIAEIGWPLGFKLASLSVSKSQHIAWISFAVFAMFISGVCLYIAQREIPIGTAYLVWTGVGGLGTFLIGVIFFGDASSLLRYFGALLILSGLVVLKIA